MRGSFVFRVSYRNHLCLVLFSYLFISLVRCQVSIIERVPSHRVWTKYQIKFRIIGTLDRPRLIYNALPSCFFSVGRDLHLDNTATAVHRSRHTTLYRERIRVRWEVLLQEARLASLPSSTLFLAQTMTPLLYTDPIAWVEMIAYPLWSLWRKCTRKGK